MRITDCESRYCWNTPFVIRYPQSIDYSSPLTKSQTWTKSRLVDYLSLKAAVSEAAGKLTGATIDDAWQAGPSEVVLTTRRGPDLLLSIDPQHPGLYLAGTCELPAKGSSSFTNLLRARIKGTTMVSIELPVAGERVVILHFASAWPAREGAPLDIVLEVMGRRSNLMVLEDGRIVQPLRVVPRDRSPARPVVAGEPYGPPPCKTGIPVEAVTADELPALDFKDAPHKLLEHIRGLSPYTAQQIIQRALRKSPDGATRVDREDLASVIRQLVASCTGDSGYLLRSGKKTHLSPFEPLPSDASDTVERFRPFSKAGAIWKGADPSGAGQINDEAAYLGKALLDRLHRIRTALEHLEDEEERCHEHHGVRVKAETLLINAAGIMPGSESVTLPDPYELGSEITIFLDRAKSPQENAEELFNRARRLRRGIEETRSKKRRLSAEGEETQQALEALNQRKDPEPARRLLGVTASGTGKKRGEPQTAYSGPGRRYIVDGFVILVGKSSTDNERVTFKAAGPGDLWLHARDYTGSHVVILTGKKPVPDKVLYAAAAKAAKASGARNESSPEIMVTERKWVRKLKGGKPGQVTVERFKTIRPRSQESGARSQQK